MKTKLRFQIISVLTIVLPFMLNAVTIYSPLEQEVEDYSFSDDRGDTITIKLFSGYKNDPQIMSRILTDIGGLQHYNARKESYSRVLRSIAFQEEFSDIDMFLLSENIEGVTKTELYQAAKFTTNGLVSNVLSDFVAHGAQYIGKAANLQYVEGTNAYFKYLNKLKAIGRNVRHTNPSAIGSYMSNGLSVLSIGMDSFQIMSNNQKVLFTYTVMKTAQVDIAIGRIKTLQELDLIHDPAYHEALQQIETELLSIPGDFMQKMWMTLKMHEDEAIQNIILTGNIGNSLASIICSGNPVTLWIGALIFAGKTAYDIIEWNKTIRDAQLAATCYYKVKDGLNLRNSMIYSDIVIQLMEYSQFLYYKLHVDVFNNGWLKIWEFFFNSRGDIRIYFENYYDWVMDDVIAQRARRLFYELPANDSRSDCLIGFILDTSGSMQGRKSEMCKSALQMIAHDRMDESMDDVMLVTFNSDASWINQSNWHNWNRQSLLHSISNIGFGGGTKFSTGLNKMKSAVQQAGSAQQKAIIMLSDGQNDGNDNYRAYTDWFASQSIPIYTISFMKESNEVSMTDIAKRTQGIFMKARDEVDVFTVFNVYYHQITGGNQLARYTSMISQDQVVIYEFYNDATGDFLYCPLIWEGSTVEMTLTSPSGVKYKEGGRNAEWNIGKNYCTTKIPQPESGKWKVELLGKEIPAKGEEFTFESYSRSDLHFKVETSEAGFLSLDVIPDSPYKVSSMQVKAIAETPGGRKIDLQNYITNNQIRFAPTHGKGNYIVSMEVTGKTNNGMNFQRFFEKHLYYDAKKPPNAGKITEIMGTIVYADIGSNVGNVPGLTCYAVRGDRFDSKTCIAKGYVLSCMDGNCTAEFIDVGVQDIKVGDWLLLDENEWIAQPNKN